jgi:Amidohydrolase
MIHPSHPVNAANRFGIDYREAAARLGPPPVPITDIHVHVNGATASGVYREASRQFGVARILTQTRIADAPAVRELFGDAASFIAVPNWASADKSRAFRDGFLDEMQAWHQRFGARVVKFWAAPRLWEIVGGDPSDVVPLDSEWRVRAAELAMSLGMMFMTHVGDPDTWFKTKYSDAAKYRTKPDQYIGLERMLDRFPVPWIAAHMGGYPEDLDFLDGLMERHDNLCLDTSATKWVVRELSRHPRERVREFYERWRGRVFFGSDVVALEDHMAPRQGGPPATPMSDLATSPEEAFVLYASRYYALRTMFETDYEGLSPIADPDLMMVEPETHTPMSAPRLSGLNLPKDLLREMYQGAAERLVFRWIREH